MYDHRSSFEHPLTPSTLISIHPFQSINPAIYMYSFIQPSTHSFTFHPSITRSFIYLSTHSYSIVHPFMNPLLHTSSHPPTCIYTSISFIQCPHIHPFIHPSIHLHVHCVFTHRFTFLHSMSTH